MESGTMHNAPPPLLIYQGPLMYKAHKNTTTNSVTKTVKATAIP